MKKIGIVGADIQWDELQERSEGFELWSCNNLYNAFDMDSRRFTKWFELHDISRKGKQWRRRASDHYPFTGDRTVREYIAELDSLGIPVFMQRKWRAIKKSEVFPFEVLMDHYGTYFGCSFTWMMALALHEGADEIGLFGMNFGSNEYYYQRPSLEYMIGFAGGRGIPVTIDQESCQLLKEPYIYAIQEDHDLIYMLHGRFAMEMAVTISTAIQRSMSKFWYDRYWRTEK